MLLSRTWIVLATIIISKASALDMLIKKVVCDSRPVQVSFDYICNGDYLCTFGEIESMEGSYVYYGLVDQFNATADDILVMDGTMNFFLTGYTHKQNMISGVPMPICNNALVADQANENGACPNDGKYKFDTVYNMPNIESEYVGWAATGWSGEVVLDIYLNRTQDLVGRCKLKVETMVTGAYEQGAFRTMPSAKIVAYSVTSVLAVCLLWCLYSCCCGRRSQRRTKEEALLEDTEPKTEYTSVNKIGTFLL